MSGLSVPIDWVVGASFNLEGDHLVTASNDNVLRIWDLEKGHAVAQVNFDVGPRAVDWVGERIVVGLQNGLVCFLDTQ